MSGPPPSHLMLLSDLYKCTPGQKVRFLGCVDDYNVQTATLRLKHDYPASEAPKPARLAKVNMELVLESVKRTEIDVGTWLNVIGYIERHKREGISVQAIAVWDAGNIDVKSYERSVDARKEIAH